jgi:hypothetical protein
MEDFPVSLMLTIMGATLGTLTTTVELPQADGDRFLTYIASVYGTNDDGSPRTAAQAVEAFIGRVWAEQAFKATRWEQERAANAASEAVAPLTFRFSE